MLSKLFGALGDKKAAGRCYKDAVKKMAEGDTGRIADSKKYWGI